MFENVKADYLIVGADASGMAFADTLLAESAASIMTASTLDDGILRCISSDTLKISISISISTYHDNCAQTKEVVLRLFNVCSKSEHF
jgi:hypothetical protein|tara:strand:- start:630 stop:893 length:264 start_codon:yes stop_codon:yes gene_type:complete